MGVKYKVLIYLLLNCVVFSLSKAQVGDISLEEAGFRSAAAPTWFSLVIDSSVIGDSVRIPNLVKPLRLNGRNHIYTNYFDMVHDSQYVYSVFLTVMSNRGGYLLEKRDIETGEVIWQYRYDHRNGDTLEIPFKLFVRSGELHLFSLRALEPYPIENMLSKVLLGLPVVWSLTRFDIGSGRPIQRSYVVDTNHVLKTNKRRRYHIFAGPRDRYYFVELERDSSRVWYKRCVFTEALGLDSCVRFQVGALSVTGATDSTEITGYHEMVSIPNGYVSMDWRRVRNPEDFMINIWVWDSTLIPVKQIDLLASDSSEIERRGYELIYADAKHFIMKSNVKKIDSTTMRHGEEYIEVIDYDGRKKMRVQIPITIDILSGELKKPYDYGFYLPWDRCIVLQRREGEDRSMLQMVSLCDTSIVLGDGPRGGGVVFALSNPEYRLKIYRDPLLLWGDRDIIALSELYIEKELVDIFGVKGGISIPVGRFIGRFSGRYFEKGVWTKGEQTDSPNITIYPNPTTGDAVYVEGIGDEPRMRVRCFDVMGRPYPVLLRGSVIDVPSIPSGVYYLQFITLDGEHRGTVRWVRIK